MTKANTTTQAENNGAAGAQPPRAARKAKQAATAVSLPTYAEKKRAYRALERVVRKADRSDAPDVLRALDQMAAASIAWRFGMLPPAETLSLPYRAHRQLYMESWGAYEAATVFNDFDSAAGAAEAVNTAEASYDAATAKFIAFSPPGLDEIIDKASMLRMDQCVDNALALDVITRDIAIFNAAMIEKDELLSNLWKAIDESNGRAFKAAVDRRQELRDAASAYEDANDSDITPEAARELSKAEMAVYTTPAPNIEAVLWKLEDNMITEQGVDTVEEALAVMDAGDLGEKCEAHVYRDLLRLSGRPIPKPAPQLLAAE